MPTYVAVFALVLAYLALVAAYVALRTLASLRRSTVLLARGTRGEAGGESLLETTGRYAERTEVVAERLEAVAAQTEAVAERARAIDAGLEQLRRAVEADHADRAAADRAAADRAAADAASSGARNGALRNTALVRYDAFADLSGRMSFSLALLDEDGNGVTLSAIAGRSDTRIYAKSVALGRGEHELSPEEQQAVAAALDAKRGLLHRRSA